MNPDKDSAFKTNDRDDGKRDIYFNSGSKDGGKHGHVVEIDKAEGTMEYHYVRDKDGNVYKDDSKK